jgi:hypothetical protein
MEDFVKSFESFQNEGKMWVSGVKPNKGAMHKALGLPEDKKVTDVYKSGKKLAEDLVSKVGKKKASGMINFAANADKTENIFDVAQKHLSKIEESINNENRFSNLENEVSIKIDATLSGRNVDRLIRDIKKVISNYEGKIKLYIDNEETNRYRENSDLM